MKILIRLISALLITISLIALYIYGLNFGADLKGGAMLEITSLDSIEKIRSIIGYDVSVQAIYNTNNFIITGNNLNNIKEQLQGLTSVIIQSENFISPKHGLDILINNFIGVLLSLIAMWCYMSIRFCVKYSNITVLALIHDCICTLGFYALTGLEFTEYELTGLIIIIGYSINATIIILDKIRDSNAQTEEEISIAVWAMFKRAMLTSGVVVLALSILSSAGGVFFHCSMPALIGTIIGTYSSISFTRYFI